MRTLIATVMQNSKSKGIYCAAKKVSDHAMDCIRSYDRKILEDAGFTFIKLLSPEYSDIKGYAIFYEGHLDEMEKALKGMHLSR